MYSVKSVRAWSRWPAERWLWARDSESRSS